MSLTSFDPPVVKDVRSGEASAKNPEAMAVSVPAHTFSKSSIPTVSSVALPSSSNGSRMPASAGAAPPKARNWIDRNINDVTVVIQRRFRRATGLSQLIARRARLWPLIARKRAQRGARLLYWGSSCFTRSSVHRMDNSVPVDGGGRNLGSL